MSRINQMGYMEPLTQDVVSKEEMNHNLLYLHGISGRIYRTNKRMVRIGISSKIPSQKRNMHIMLLDFDSQDMKKVKKQLLKSIRVRHCLSNIYIIRTSRGRYAAICFKPIKWVAYKDILFKTSVDVRFRYFAYKRSHATLRISPKFEKPSTLEITDVLPAWKNYQITEDTKLKLAFMQMINMESWGRGLDKTHVNQTTFVPVSRPENTTKNGEQK